MIKIQEDKKIELGGHKKRQNREQGKNFTYFMKNTSKQDKDIYVIQESKKIKTTLKQHHTFNKY